MLNKEISPDLIISEGLSDPNLLDHFEPLSGLFREERIEPKDFYQDLLSLGRREKTQFILPLNFDLPTVVFRDQSFQQEHNGLLMPIDSMRQLGSEYNETVKEKLKKETKTAKALGAQNKVKRILWVSKKGKKLYGEVRKLRDMKEMFLCYWIKPVN